MRIFFFLQNIWHRQFATQYRNCTVDLMSTFKTKKYAVLCKQVENFPLSVHSECADLKNTYILPEVINNFLLGIAFAKGSPLANHVSR